MRLADGKPFIKAKLIYQFSNKSYLEWGKPFGDDVLAIAILDHLLHHSVTFCIKGDSHRMEEKKIAGVFPLPSTVE